jgi:hypothetical protein
MVCIVCTLIKIIKDFSRKAAMSTNLTASLLLQAQAIYTNANAVSTPSDSPTIKQTNAYTNGSAANQASLLYYASRLLTATSETLDLTALTDIFGNAVNFTANGIKAIGIVNTNAATGAVLKVGGAATAAWIGGSGAHAGPFNATTDVQIIGAGGKWCQESPTDGFSVASGSKNLKVDAGSATITYQIFIWG